MKWCGYELIKWYTMAKSAIFKAQEREVLQKFTSTSNHYHSAKGMQLKLAALQMLSYVHAFHEFSKQKDQTGCHRTIANCDSLKQAWDPMTFINNVKVLMKINPEFSKSIPFLMLQSVVAKYCGWKNAPYLEKLMNFHQLVATHSPVALSVISANTYGPSIRHIKWTQQCKFAQSLIIDCSESAIIEHLWLFAKPMLDIGEGPCVLSMQRDAVHVPETIQFACHYQAVVGCAAPNHIQYVSDADPSILDEETRNFADFVCSDGFLLAQELKVVSVTCRDQFMLCPIQLLLQHICNTRMLLQY